MINSFFLFEKIMNLLHQLDNTVGTNGSSKRRKQVYWGETKINQWLFKNSKDDHQQQNRSRPTKMTITSRDDHQQYQQLQPVRMIRTAKGNNNQLHLILHRYPRHHHQGNLLRQKLVQPNNLPKVLTANVQSLSPKIDELIALIQVENFDVIALNETWLDIQNKHMLAEEKLPYMVTSLVMWRNHLHRKGR